MSQATLSAKSAKAAEARGASTSSTLRGAARGNLSSLLGRGSFAFDPSSISGGGISAHMRGQLAQPRAGASNRYCNDANYAQSRILETHLFEVNRFCFKNLASPVLMSTEERFKQMSLDPPPAVLACIQLVTDVSNGEPLYGKPFITVLGAPLASPDGEIVPSSEIWPGLSDLKPIGYGLDEDLVSLLGASTHHASRSHATSSVKTTMSSFLDTMVYTLEGKELCEVGFILSADVPQERADLLYYSDYSKDLPIDINDKTYLGKGNYQDLIDSNKHQIVLLPVAMPLPFGHSIPMGQVFDADGGYKGFLEAMVEMSSDEDLDAGLSDRLCWLEKSKYLEEWLDAVKADSKQFAVQFLARESIVASITAPNEVKGETAMITSDSLAPVMWIDYGVARQLQRDNIMATLKPPQAEECDRLEKRQMENFSRSKDDPPIFGFPSITVNAAIWALRPPVSDAARKRFGMDSFLDPSVVPPQTESYQRVSIPSALRLPKGYEIIPLETVAEVQEAIAAEAPASSPSKERERQRLASAKRKRLSQGTDSPLRHSSLHQTQGPNQLQTTSLEVDPNPCVTPNSSSNAKAFGQPRTQQPVTRRVHLCSVPTLRLTRKQKRVVRPISPTSFTSREGLVVLVLR